MTASTGARKRRINWPGMQPGDAISEAMETDSIRVAADLEEALADLGGVTESSVRIVVYRVSQKGDWEHVKQLSPPLKVSELINDVEDTYGPGKYAVRILADGRIKTTKFFNIAAPKDDRRSLFAGPDGMTAGSLLKLLLDRDSKGGGSEMMMLLMKMQQDSTTAMLQMQQTSTQQMMGLIASLMGSRGDPADQFLKSAEIIKAMQGPQTTAKDVLETFAMVRDIAGEGNGGSGGFLGLAEKFLPAMTTLAAAQGAPPPAAPGPARAALPAPGPSASRAPPPAVHGAAKPAGEASAPPAEGAAAPGHPILGLIQPEIEFFMARGHDPELAAEAIADVLRARGVTAEALFAFGLEIQGADGNYVGRLGQLGLDVAGNTAWFESMLGFLAEIYADPDQVDADQVADQVAAGLGLPAAGELAGELAGEPAPGAAHHEPPPDRAGQNGRGSDPGSDASPRAARRPANPHKKPGRTAH